MKKLFLFSLVVCTILAGCEKENANPVNGQGELNYGEAVYAFDIGKYSPDAGEFLPNPHYNYYFAFTSGEEEGRLDMFLYLNGETSLSGKYSYITYNYTTTRGVNMSLIKQKNDAVVGDGFAVVEFEELSDGKYEISVSLPILDFEFNWSGELKKINKLEAPTE